MSTNYQSVYDLKVKEDLLSFINDELLRGTDIQPEKFWPGFSNIVHELAPKNRQLIEFRDTLQKKIDDWHIKKKEMKLKLMNIKNFLKR